MRRVCRLPPCGEACVDFKERYPRSGKCASIDALERDPSGWTEAFCPYEANRARRRDVGARVLRCGGDELLEADDGGQQCALHARREGARGVEDGRAVHDGAGGAARDESRRGCAQGADSGWAVTWTGNERMAIKRRICFFIFITIVSCEIVFDSTCQML